MTVGVREGMEEELRGESRLPGLYIPAPKPTQFEGGATRSPTDDRYDFEGFLSPLVLDRYAEYMHKHRLQADGTLRDSDNWQKGIPRWRYMKGAWRHFMDWWRGHRSLDNLAQFYNLSDDFLEEAICAVLFNAMGYLHELRKHRLGLAIRKNETVEFNPVPHD